MGDVQTGPQNEFSLYRSDQGLDNRILISAGILAVLFVLDVLTTEIILSDGGVEYNPFMAGIVQNPLIHILIKLLLLILVVIAAQYSEDTLKGSSMTLFIIVIGWYLICIGNNLGSILNALF